MKKNKFKKLFTTSLAVVASLGIASSALAADTGTTTITQQINGGVKSLEVTATSQFTPITLDGTVQKTQANLGTLKTTDATGTGDGWRIDVSASQLTEVAPVGGFKAGTSAKTLPKGSLEIKNNNASISKDAGTTAAAPKFVGSNWIIDNGTPVTLLKADKDEGMGKYTIDFGANSLELTLMPSDTYVDKENYPSGATPYQTEVTYAITTGP